MVNILFYTSGTTGSGRIMLGISIGTALIRNKVICSFTILGSSPFNHLADFFNIKYIKIPFEPEENLGKDSYLNSTLYQTLAELKPDIIIVDLIWFPMYHFIDNLPCKKILLCRQISDDYFTIPLPDEHLHFNPDQYDKIISTEPYESKLKVDSINPVILRNRNEIYDKNKALNLLGLTEDKPMCLLAHNGKPGEYDEIVKTYSYLEDEGYNMVYSTNYRGGIFPVVDYFNAFDLIITSGGYNSFWEAQFFDKEALFIPQPRQFEDQEKRINECSGMIFKENGADQLATILSELAN